MLENSNGLNENIERKRDDIRGQFLIGVERREKEEKSTFRRLKKNIIKVVAGAAIVCGVTAAACYVSPAFADMVKDIPVLSIFSKIVEKEKNEKIAVEHDYGKEINVYYEDGEFKLSFIYGIRDNQKLVLGYELEKNNNLYGKSLMTLKNVRIKDDKGYIWKSTELSLSSSSPGEGIVRIRNEHIWYDHDMNKDGEAHEFNINDIEGSIYLSCDIHELDKEDSKRLMRIRNFEIPIGELTKSNGCTVEPQKEIKVEEEVLRLNSISIEPTEMMLDLKWYVADEELTVRGTDCIEIVLEDNKGVVYKEKTGTGVMGSYSYNEERKEMDLKYFMDSPYFKDIEFLKFNRITIYKPSIEKIKVDVVDGTFQPDASDGITIEGMSWNDGNLLLEYSSNDLKDKVNLLLRIDVDTMYDKKVVKNGRAETSYVNDEGIEVKKIKIGMKEADISLEDIKEIEFSFIRKQPTVERIFKDEVKIYTRKTYEKLTE